MFGFLYAPSTTCGPAARSLYQSLFCGLACQLHKDYHISARFLVNRDSTFLSLLGASLQNEPAQTLQRTCCNPLSTPRAVAMDHATQSYSAAVAVAALATKLDDNVQDENGLRKHLPHFASRLIRPARDKATAILNSSHFPTQSVTCQLDGQNLLEQRQPSFEAASAPTASAYGTIFAHLANIHQRPELRGSLLQLGTSLGRLIYWKDAVDDWNSDLKRGRFNPLIHHPAEELPPLVEREFSELKNVAETTPWPRHADVIRSVIDHTLSHHQSLADKPSPKTSKKKRKRKKESGCFDAFDCCYCGDCCSAIDCCPDACGSSGDAATGCCDCGCSGCDCCSCS